MLKNKITLFSILIVVIGISAIALLGVAQTQQNNDKKETKVRNTEKEKDKFEPTTIEDGVMTAKQKKHSKIYKGYKDRAKIRDLITQQGDVNIIYPTGDVIIPESFNLDNYLQELSCNADAVVVGTVKTKASQINEDGTFVFTDYEFTSSEVLKNNATEPISQDSDITITRTGGFIKLKEHTARATDYRQVPLIVGEKYLLFLKFYPETGAYRSINSSQYDDSFQILGDRLIKQVSRQPLPFDGNRTVEASGFIAQVRVAINGVCSPQGGEK